MQLEQLDGYNPLLVHSGLHDNIAVMAMRKTQLWRGGSRGGRAGGVEGEEVEGGEEEGEEGVVEEGGLMGGEWRRQALFPG